MIYFILNENQSQLTNETVNSKDILRIEKQLTVYQNDFHTWTNEDVILKDGRKVTIRCVERNQLYMKDLIK